MDYTVVSPFVGRAAYGAYFAFNKWPRAIFSYSTNWRHEKYLAEYIPDTPWYYLDTPYGSRAYKKFPHSDVVIYGEPFLKMHRLMTRASSQFMTTEFDIWKEFVHWVEDTILNSRPKVIIAEIPNRVFREDAGTSEGIKHYQKFLFNALRWHNYSLTLFLTSPFFHGTPDKMHRCFMIAWRSSKSPKVPERISDFECPTFHDFFKYGVVTAIPNKIIEAQHDFVRNPYIQYAQILNWSLTDWDSPQLTIQARLIEEGRLGEFGRWLLDQRGDDARETAVTVFNVLNRNSPEDFSPKIIDVFDELIRPENYENIVHPYEDRFITTLEVFQLVGYTIGMAPTQETNSEKIDEFIRMNELTAPVDTWREVLNYVKSVFEGKRYFSNTNYYFWDNNVGQRVARKRPRKDTGT